MTVYSMVEGFCNEVAAGWRKSQRQNLALAMNGILARRSLTLSHIAQHFPLAEAVKVKRRKHGLWHRLKRLRRFLANPRLALEPVLTRLNHMAFVVSDEPGKAISVLLDLTYLEPYAFLVASVPKGGRALPIGWHVFRRDLAGEGAVSQNQLIDRLVGQVLERIPRGITPIVVADREFARASFFRFLQAEQRDFVVRVDRETWVIHPTYTGPMGKLASRPGMHKRWLPAALYAQEEQVPINLLVVWQRGYREPWLLATSLDDPQRALALYRSRMKIEHGFRDWKTHLRLKGTLHAQNIAYVRGLMLVLALLYWFVCLCGLRWNHPRFRSRIACWGTPSFFKTALDLLLSHDPLALASWPRILAWIHDKLKFFQPCPRPYALRYRRNRPWYLQTG